MPNKRISTFNQLLDAPWWVSVLIAALVYVGDVLFVAFAKYGQSHCRYGVEIAEDSCALFYFSYFDNYAFFLFNTRRQAQQLDRQNDLTAISLSFVKSNERLLY